MWLQNQFIPMVHWNKINAAEVINKVIKYNFGAI